MSRTRTYEHPRLELCHFRALIGAQVRLIWDGDEGPETLEGVVVKYSKKKYMYLVQFFDGDVEWIDLKASSSSIQILHDTVWIHGSHYRPSEKAQKMSMFQGLQAYVYVFEKMSWCTGDVFSYDEASDTLRVKLSEEETLWVNIDQYGESFKVLDGSIWFSGPEFWSYIQQIWKKPTKGQHDDGVSVSQASQQQDTTLSYGEQGAAVPYAADGTQQTEAQGYYPLSDGTAASSGGWYNEGVGAATAPVDEQYAWQQQNQYDPVGALLQGEDYSQYNDQASSQQQFAGYQEYVEYPSWTVGEEVYAGENGAAALSEPILSNEYAVPDSLEA